MDEIAKRRNLLRFKASIDADLLTVQDSFAQKQLPAQTHVKSAAGSSVQLQAQAQAQVQVQSSVQTEIPHYMRPLGRHNLSPSSATRNWLTAKPNRRVLKPSASQSLHKTLSGQLGTQGPGQTSSEFGVFRETAAHVRDTKLHMGLPASPADTRGQLAHSIVDVRSESLFQTAEKEETTVNLFEQKERDIAELQGAAATSTDDPDSGKGRMAKLILGHIVKKETKKEPRRALGLGWSRLSFSPIHATSKV